MDHRVAIERDLRTRLSDREFATLVEQLQSAVAAFDFLRKRAPEVLRLIHSDMQLVSTNDMSERAESVLRRLAHELRVVHKQRETLSRWQKLKLVYSRREMNPAQ